MKKNSLFKFLKKDIVIFMTGLALVSYPVISNCIESKSQTGQIATYKEKTTDTAAEDKRCLIEDAEKWNMELYMNQKGIPASREFKYEDILDIGNGMIGSIEIPCIDVNMPIYHGTSDSVLSTGAGHIPILCKLVQIAVNGCDIYLTVMFLQILIHIELTEKPLTASVYPILSS